MEQDPTKSIIDTYNNMVTPEEALTPEQEDALRIVLNGGSAPEGVNLPRALTGQQKNGHLRSVDDRNPGMFYRRRF